MVLMVSSTQAVTLKVDPSVVLATREYVNQKCCSGDSGVRGQSGKDLSADW